MESFSVEFWRVEQTGQELSNPPIRPPAAADGADKRRRRPRAIAGYDLLDPIMATAYTTSIVIFPEAYGPDYKTRWIRYIRWIRFERK